MDIITAKIILANLRERIEISADGKYRLPGIITNKELDVLDFFISGQLGEFADALQPTFSDAIPTNVSKEIQIFVEDFGKTTFPAEKIPLNISTLELPESDASYRVCLDFGTAMSKASFVYDNEDTGVEEIHVLKLGTPGDQEEIDEVMLVSSVFIDVDGLLWFGQHAIERAQLAPEGSNSRLDNIKRALSEGNMDEPVDTTYNPTEFRLTYEDVVLAYLAFFTWTVNDAIKNDITEPKVASNFKRRFAMPCFPKANARIVDGKLKTLLGEAQILADTFQEKIHQGLPLKDFLSALTQLRAIKRNYLFVEGSVTEPLGVAGSLLSWRSSQDSLALVVDVGAGTSDFSLYRLKVTMDEEGEIDKTKTTAGEVEGTARGVLEAGNHLDKILMAYILQKSGVDGSHPKYVNITHALERGIRDYKESLFNGGSVLISLYSGEAVEIRLEEFLELEAVKSFEDSLRKTMIDILRSANRDWIDWILSDATRCLTIVLTGGGASLPMVKALANGRIEVHGSAIPVAAAKSFPNWLSTDFPDLEDHYSRVAVSLGGARQNTFRSLGMLTSTGNGLGGFTLGGFPIKGG